MSSDQAETSSTRIALNLRVRLCYGHDSRPEPLQPKRIAVTMKDLESSDAFDAALRREWWWWPLQKGTRKEIDKKHLRYVIHRHVPNFGPCSRVLTPADFLPGGSEEDTYKLPGVFYDMHVLPRPGFDGEFGNSPGTPNPTLFGIDEVGVLVAAPPKQGAPVAASERATIDASLAPDTGDAAPGVAVRLQLEVEAQNPAITSILPASTVHSAVRSPNPPPSGTHEAGNDDTEELPRDEPQGTVLDAVDEMDTQINATQPHHNQTGATQSDASKSETFQANTEAEDADDQKGLTFIRIGRILIGNGGHEDAIERQYLVVAAITKERPNAVEYQRVPTYLINGSFIGDYESTVDLTGTVYQLDQFEIDPMFEKAYNNQTLNDRVREIAVKVNNRNKLADLYDAPCIAKLPSDEHVATVPPKNRMPVLKPGQEEEDDIRAVISIVDLSSHPIGLNLDDNIQAELPHNETYATFRRDATQAVVVRENKDETLSLTEVLDEVDHPGWDVRIYVVPQSAAKKMWEKPMYEWTANSPYVARDFLDRKVWARGHKDLYVEMHIIDKERDAEGT